MQLRASGFVFIIVALMPVKAGADCANPAMPTGTIFYNSDFETMQYCGRDDTWITFDGIGIGCNTGDGIVMSSSGWTCSPGGPP